MTSIVTQTKTSPTVSIGIDWADKLHAFHLLGPDQAEQFGTCEQDAQTIDAQLAQWRVAYPGSTFEIAIEQTKGPLISALLKHADIVIYPVNPAASASYRKAFKHGGGKNDPTDAMLLCQYLQHYRDQLRPLRHEQPLTRELAALAQDRRRLVDQRTALCNELKDVLKRYFPEVLKLGAAKIYADFLLAFLIKYPSLGQAKKTGATRLRKFFIGAGAKRKAEERVQLLLEATSLTDDEVLVRTCGRRVVALTRMIQTYKQQIKIYDNEISELVCQHADYEIYASLPGAADLTHCPMVAAMGDDRSRYADAASLQAAR